MLHLFGILKQRTIQVLERSSSLEKGIQKEEIYKILHFKHQLLWHVWADLLIGKFTSETTVEQLVLFKSIELIRVEKVNIVTF